MPDQAPHKLILEREITFSVRDVESGAKVSFILSGFPAASSVTKLKPFDWTPVAEPLLSDMYHFPDGTIYEWADPKEEG